MQERASFARKALDTKQPLEATRLRGKFSFQMALGSQDAANTLKVLQGQHKEFVLRILPPQLPLFLLCTLKVGEKPRTDVFLLKPLCSTSSTLQSNDLHHLVVSLHELLCCGLAERSIHGDQAGGYCALCAHSRHLSLRLSSPTALPPAMSCTEVQTLTGQPQPGISAHHAYRPRSLQRQISACISASLQGKERPGRSRSHCCNFRQDQTEKQQLG